MTQLDILLEPLRHSPQLPEVVEELGRHLAAERERRQRFYEEMTPEQKIEFIGGDVVLHSPARSRHLDVTMRVATLLRTWVNLRQLGAIKVEKCLCVFPRNDYEPDVVFFGPEKCALIEPDTMRFPIPDLAVEVLSESTENRDRGVKYEDFAVHGVAEYWIIDADRAVLEQYVLSENGDYELRLKSGSGRIESVAVSGFVTEVEAFFDEEKNLAALRKLVG